ncbi:MAG: hypothetical protein MAG431_00480 [Chloroflexi bacterium]|nr:hypothetical protein [Chloroflexota bacterium]
MKKKITYGMLFVVLFSLAIGGTASAQYEGSNWNTAYQVVNMGSAPADIVVKYYDSAGTEITAAEKTFTDVPVNGSVLVVQYSDDPNLPDGTYSAIISADQPVAAISNIQLVPDGASEYTPGPPFSTYSGQGAGATTLTLPSVMHNWYGYYTEIIIMNTASSQATDVDITYVPGTMDVGNGPEATGASGVTEVDLTIPGYASLVKSQENKTELGAPDGTFAGKFFGAANITSDQPIIAIVNQHNVGDVKLMTYNGFTEAGATEVLVPTHMRGFYNYYTTLLVSNPSDTVDAQVTITYTPDENYSNVPEDGSSVGTVVANHTISPQTTLLRYDGPGASDGQSDLDDHDETGHAYTRFFGSAKVTSDNPVLVQVNIEAASTSAGQAGSFNGIAVADASTDLVAPVILADFYGYYTSLVVQNATGTEGTCNITYTSDDTYSAVKNHSETYTHTLPASASFMIYEGRANDQEIGDINSDVTWRADGNKEFIGSAVISCDVDVVAFVNEETNKNNRDSMYTMNTFKK